MKGEGGIPTHFLETKQSKEPVSDTTQMLQLSEREYKTSVINVSKAQEEKVDSSYRFRKSIS